MRLDDLDLMPFGKFKGTPMQDVPANYLFWLWTTGKENDSRCPVADYIRHNLEVLEKDYPDGIWRK